MVDNEDSVISTSTIVRWIIGASAAIIMTGGSVWLNMVSKQMDRIEENFSARLSKMEQTIDSIKSQEATTADKASGQLVDLKIETKMHALRIEQLERALEALVTAQDNAHKAIPPSLKKNSYEIPYPYKPPTLNEVSYDFYKGWNRKDRTS